ncbi:Mitogen-activated protein kinase organizer 1 [Cricetulus griseus]|uniref:WD repeat domain-containing protein 83 n=1 Tax=Cricetulus griseus TaxID=10029 RepID=G3I3L1_CRIGR|nr:Mitogen-activated protein kinase organizer 1 [Cricetulus griseus]
MGQVFSDYVGSPIICTCFSQDGQCTLISSLDSTLQLLDKDTEELLGKYVGHKSQKYKLDCCLSEHDTHVVSCSDDGKVVFWDLVEGALVLALSVGSSVAQSLAYHPMEPCLLTAMLGVRGVSASSTGKKRPMRQRVEQAED